MTVTVIVLLVNNYNKYNYINNHSLHEQIIQYVLDTNLNTEEYELL